MLDRKLVLLFYCFALAGFVLCSEAYKGITFSFPAKENGTCFRRVPYNDALLANVSKGLVEIVAGSERDAVKSGKTGWVSVLDCCDGFKRNNETGKCESHCEDGCISGTCVGPNTCSCEVGWRLVSPTECKPVCRRGCQEHAYCFGPDVCSCEFGYREVNGECQPVCLHDCLHGDCLAPRACRCHPGYTLNETKHCEALCDGGCPHGYCESPGVCSCSHGYVHPLHTRETCVPYCPDNCKNGVCHSPGLCTCNEGYTRDGNGSCVPECTNGCRNGQCLAPGQCRCDSGFVMDHQLEQCVEYNRQHPSSNDRKYQQNGYNAYGYRQTPIPPRVIGLNETNTTQTTHTSHDLRQSYEIDQQHESQGHIIPYSYVPVHVTHTTPRQNQMQDHRGSYRDYESHYGREQITADRPGVTQNPRVTVYEVRDPYRKDEISQTHESQQHESQQHEVEKTMNPHEINQTPRAHIIITPHRISTDYTDYTTRPHPIHETTRQTYSNQYQYERSRENQDSQIYSDPYHKQNVHIKTNNLRPVYVDPAVGQITSYNRENVNFEIEQQNISESTLLINHPHRINSNPKSCDSESDEDEESTEDRYYYTQQDGLPREFSPQNQWYGPPPTTAKPQNQWYGPPPTTAKPQNQWYGPPPTTAKPQIPSRIRRPPPLIADDTEYFRHMNEHYEAQKKQHDEQICQSNCLNGKCINQQCVCNPGYKSVTKNGKVECAPQCPGGCLNGVCSAPNLCICNMGFIKEYGLKDSQTCVALD